MARHASSYRDARREAARKDNTEMERFSSSTARYVGFWAPSSKYVPHQSAREKARRLRQAA